MTIEHQAIVVKYGKRKIAFSLYYEERKSVTVTVTPDMRIIVKAPEEYKQHKNEKLEMKLRQKLPWISKQFDFFEKMPLPQSLRKYINGETYYYLGRQYRLKIHDSNKNHVKLIGRYFDVYRLPKSSKRTVMMEMQKWYEEHARQIIEQKMDSFYLLLKSRLKVIPKVQFRWMQNRWGSCSPKGTITINYELIKAPLSCVEYVVLHEVCHLKYPNHDKRFYNLLTTYMPNWEKRKERLEMVGI